MQEFIYFSFFLFLTLPSLSEAALKNLPPKVEEAIAAKDLVKAKSQSKPKPERCRFHSVVPLGGYNPTYGIFLGVGYFRQLVEEEEKTNWGLVAVVSQYHRAVKTEFKGESRLNR